MREERCVHSRSLRWPSVRVRCRARFPRQFQQERGAVCFELTLHPNTLRSRIKKPAPVQPRVDGMTDPCTAPCTPDDRRARPLAALRDYDILPSGLVVSTSSPR